MEAGNRMSMVAQPDKIVEQKARPLSMLESTEKCVSCTQRVYPLDKLVISSSNGELIFHKTCFRCKECKKVLNIGNFSGVHGVYYCKVHYKRLFKEKGNYDEGFGVAQHKNKWIRGTTLGQSDNVNDDDNDEYDDNDGIFTASSNGDIAPAPLAQTITPDDGDNTCSANPVPVRQGSGSFVPRETPKPEQKSSEHQLDVPKVEKLTMNKAPSIAASTSPNLVSQSASNPKSDSDVRSATIPVAKIPIIGGAETPICATCSKKVYPVDMLNMGDHKLHKACLRCSHCNMQLSVGKASYYQGSYYCGAHYSQLFKVKGNYDEGFGHQPHKNQWKNKEGELTKADRNQGI